jgi:predicted kinase
VTTRRPRVLHLNGAPGVGKSTLARRYADEHPDTLLLDIDELRSWFGGGADDYARAGALARPVALAAMTAHLSGGHDVVLPQLIARADQLALFRSAAGEADYVHVLLTAPTDTLADRHVDRLARAVGPEAAGARVLEAAGGRAQLAHVVGRLAVLAADDDVTLVLQATGDDEHATYAALLSLLG